MTLNEIRKLRGMTLSEFSRIVTPLGEIVTTAFSARAASTIVSIRGFP